MSFRSFVGYRSSYTHCKVQVTLYTYHCQTSVTVRSRTTIKLLYIFDFLMYFRSMYPWMWSVDTWFLYFTDVIVFGNVRSPLLAFCDAVMASVSAVGSKPNHKLSEECVQCVLHENRVDLLAHWISQERYKTLYIVIVWILKCFHN